MSGNEEEKISFAWASHFIGDALNEIGLDPTSAVLSLPRPAWEKLRDHLQAEIDQEREQVRGEPGYIEIASPSGEIVVTGLRIVARYDA